MPISLNLNDQIFLLPHPKCHKDSTLIAYFQELLSLEKY
nr:MAG TPA: hypothetical protein [Caudoviricetes sp.]